MAHHTTTDCGCCAGVDAVTPRRTDNPPDQPAIGYRAGRHGDFLESIRARLSSSTYPALARLTTREAGDFTLALSDALAASLDVLAFYTERFANEHYLGTAVERLSVIELARLIGYRAAPGVAASTHLAFTLQALPGVPSKPITIPVGTRVQSVPGQDEQAQTFETVEAVPAHADWNALAAQQSQPQRPGPGATGLWLTGIDSRLEPGDRIAIIGASQETDPAGAHWAVRVLDSVTRDAPRALTRLGWRAPLGSTEAFDVAADEPTRVVALATRAAVFGAIAPDWRALSAQIKADYIGLASPDALKRPGDTEEWPDFTVLAPAYPERRQSAPATVTEHLPATVQEIAGAAGSAAQAAGANALSKAASASAGVIAAGGRITEDAVGLARQSAEGLSEVARLATDEVLQQVRSLIHGQGVALQALQLGAGQLVSHGALDSARQAIGDRIASLPGRVALLAETGLTDPLAVAVAVLDELEQGWSQGVPEALLPNLQPVWDEAVATVTAAIGAVRLEAEDSHNNPAGWFSAQMSNVDAAGQALTQVSTRLDSAIEASQADSEAPAAIVREVVDKLQSAIGTELAGDQFTDLLNLSGAVGTVQQWTGSLFSAGGEFGTSLVRLQQNLMGSASNVFARLGADVARIAEQTRSSVVDSAAVLNPQAAMQALADGADAMRTHTVAAGAAAMQAAASGDVAALVSAGVTIAGALPPPLAPSTPEQMAEVVRFCAAYGVARAGGTPVGEPPAGSLLAQVAAALPAALSAPPMPDAGLLAIAGDAAALADAPLVGAQGAYQHIVAEVDRALAGRIVTGTGRRAPLVRDPDRIDLSPADDAVTAGGWALLSVPGSQTLYRIAEAYGASRAEYLLSGQTTRLRLDGRLPAGRLPGEFEHAVRTLAVHLGEDELPLAEVPLDHPVYGDTIALDAHVAGLSPGRAIALRGPRAHVLVARGAGGLHFDGADGSARTLAEGDRLALSAAPERLARGRAIYLSPAAFGDAIGVRGIRLRLAVEDRDGTAGTLECRGDQIALAAAEDDDARVAEIVFLADADAVTDDRDRSHLTLADATRHVYDRRSLAINANVAAATHGETVEQILGDGDGRRTDQRFALSQSPLTYVSAPTPSGRASTLEVRIGDVRWQEHDSLYGAAADGRVFETRQSDTAATTIRFGDGIEGARLPSGSTNVRARYRKGLGVAGNVGADTLTTLLARPLGVAEVANPEAASGGEDAESLDRARDNAPLTVLTLDRAVSIRDYADFARAFAGIDKAHALWIPAGPARGVFVTIAGVDGAALPEGSDTWANLLDALTRYGDPLMPIRLADHGDARFRCRLAVKVMADFDESAVLADVDQALRAEFAFAARSFGQAVSADEVAAIAQGRAGVEAVHVGRLYRDGAAPLRRPRLFATLPVASLTASPSPAELLTLADDGLELEVMA